MSVLIKTKPANLAQLLNYLLAPLLLIAFSTGVFADPAYLDGNKLILPVATTGEVSYYVELTIVDNTEPPELFVSYAEDRIDPDLTDAAYYSNGLLTVPSAMVGPLLYWGQFELIGENPFRFVLVNADINDDDDDNDGIPDIEDDEPYTAATDGDPLGLVGFWNFVFTISPANQVTGTACEGDPIVSDETTYISYSPIGGYIVDTPNYDGPATATPNSFSYNASYSEDGGTTQRNLSMTILSPTYMEGDETWTWSSPGQTTCANIHSSITAEKFQ